MDARRSIESLRFVFVIIVTVALTVGGANLVSFVLRRGDDEQIGVGTATAAERLPAASGLGDVKLSVKYPMRLKVHDEAEIFVYINIIRPTPQAEPARKVVIRTTSSGLTLKPSGQIETRLNGDYAFVSYIASTATPGARLLSVEMESTDFGKGFQNLGVGSLRVMAVQDTDLLARIALISNVLAIPAWIALLGTHFLGKKKTPSDSDR